MKQRTSYGMEKKQYSSTTILSRMTSKNKKRTCWLAMR